MEPVASSARYGIEQLGLNIHVGLLGAAQLRSDHFDVAYSNAVIEHLASPAEVITEVFRILRPGGLLYADILAPALVAGVVDIGLRFMGAGDDSSRITQHRNHM